MKLFFTILVVLALLVPASSCKKAEEPAPGHAESLTFTLEIPDSGARSDIDLSTGRHTWAVGDGIVIHDTRTPAYVTLKAEDISADGKTATVTVSGLDISRSEYGCFYASFPSSAFDWSLRSGNHYYLDQFSTSNAPIAVAHAEENGRFSFVNICGGVSFTTGSLDVDGYELLSNDGGAFGYSALEISDKPTYSAPRLYTYEGTVSRQDLKSISGSAGDGPAFAWFPMGQSFPSGITIYLTKGGVRTHSVKSSTPLSISMGHIADFGDISPKVKPCNTLCREEDRGQTPVVAAYYTEYSSTLPDPRNLTHIYYCHGRFANPTTGDGGITIAGTSLLRNVVALKDSYPHLKVLLMIGGWGSRADGFSAMAADPEKRTLFCTQCKSHIDTYGLDGIDIDWEYPGGGPSGNGQSQYDKDNLLLVLEELRQTIGDRKIISLAVSSNHRYYDVPGTLEYADWLNLMTYDMGDPPYHNSTLYRSSLTKSRSCESVVDDYIGAGAPASRLVLGVPFYGHGTSPYAEDVKFNEMAGILSSTTTYAGKNIRMWDDVAKVPYLVDGSGTMLLGYDDAESVAYKGGFAVSRELLGTMCWEYRHDDSDHTLIRALAKSVYGKEDISE